MSILENQALDVTEKHVTPSCKQLAILYSYLFIYFKAIQMHSEDKSSVSSDSQHENV